VEEKVSGLHLCRIQKSDLYNHIMYEAIYHNEANSDNIIKKIVKEFGINR